MGGKHSDHGNTTMVFNLWCVKLILSELFFSLLPACPEWLVLMANNELQIIPFGFFLAIFYAFLSLFVQDFHSNKISMLLFPIN